MKRWLKHTLIVLGVLALSLAIWFAGPLLGFGTSYPLEGELARGLTIGTIVLVVGVVYLIGWLRARKAEAALQAAIAPESAGDGEALAEKMEEALGVLRKSSGSSGYLYELPWYVIIGPPGAGKTTALLNSGIKFPLAEKTGGAIAGAGGTRYCDWWFSEEAVLIDTAGRYTTQDSDAQADRESWLSFLGLLKVHRARQPINGVIVAISTEELLTGTPETLEAHATAIRERLAEIHEVLKVDVPVYVMLTKADLIAGFSEFFGAFSASRRQKVWGATFKTKTRREATVQRVAEEYDALVARLSEEVTDRLQEEPDGIARIAIFGFPAQVAMLRDKVQNLLTEVFGSTRYRINATLRGFYFTSGTQEGTPIDQVLGAMERSFGPLEAAGGMSGRGRSYFLHDLLRKVIFAESGWVSFDRNAVRREAMLRYGALTAVGLFTAGLLGLWAASFYYNRALVRTAEAALAEYEMAARTELAATEIDDDDVLPVAGLLQMLRDMPTGYGDATDDRAFFERFGFSQRAALHAASRASYRDALERMFRARLILRLEDQLAEFIATNNTISLYEALKVYKLLGDAAPVRDDAFVVAWFREDWARNLYPGGGAFRDARAQLEEHLWAMLDLGQARNPRFSLNGALIEQAELMLARIEVADQAYLLVQGAVNPRELEEFNVALRAGTDAELVFETVDGRDLSEMVVPGLYTYAGFHRYFLPRLSEVAQKLESEQWVLGARAQEVDIEGQLGNLGPILLNRYALDFTNAWNEVLDNLKLRPMSADPPTFSALAAASAARLSPITLLVEAIVQETRLTEDFDAEGSFGAGMDFLSGTAGSGIAGVAAQQLATRIQQRTSGMARIGIDIALASKNTGRAGTASRSGTGAAPLPGAGVEAQFVRWHNLVEGADGQRPIDHLLGQLRNIHQLLSTATLAPGQVAEQLPGQIGALKANASRLPPPMTRMMLQAAAEFEGDAANTSIAQLNERMNNEVTQVCERIIANGYPFSARSNRDVPMTEFARLMAPGGVMDSFFNTHLLPHADISSNPWTWKEDSPIGDRLSTATLRQFQRAADIRDAFFPGGASMPGFDITITQTAMHNEVRSAMLEINGQIIATQQTGNLAQTIGWPGSGAGGSVSLQLAPEMRGRQSSIAVQPPGPWALMRFINAGSPRPSGTSVDVRYTIGGRYIAYNIRSASSLNPFFLRSLWDFGCPRGL